MRIPLAGEQARPRRRTRPVHRRSRTLDSAVAIPRAPATRARSSDQGRGRRTPATRTARRQVEAVPRRRFPWRNLLRRLPILLLTLAAISALVYAFTDAQFFVYEGHIVGARHLHPAIIYQAAGVHEQSIFWIDPNNVAARVAQVEGVKEVRVRCELPARVVISVEERQPRILWRAVMQEHDWWLDEEGVVLPYHGDPASPDLIFVVDYSSRALAVGDHVEPVELVQSVLSLAKAMPGVRIYTYHAERGLGFTQESAGSQWPVYLGSSDDLARKVQVMQAVTTYLASNDIRPRYVDVRWADHPVYGRPAGAPAANTAVEPDTQPAPVPSGGGE
ncbi:MAG TPA: FtsQ-type POTRA domain-containing protein [Anaerolineae bacterium]|nr:FtsQ-type POTRA domain-containing protein [Anaerolineae bacterium]